MIEIINRFLASPRVLTNIRSLVLVVLGLYVLPYTSNVVRGLLDVPLLGSLTVGGVFGLVAVYLGVGAWLRWVV